MTNLHRLSNLHGISRLQPKPGCAPVRVLIIEDDEDYAALLVHQLRDHARLEISVVGSLQDGYRHLAGETVDVVLLDLGLPDTQGLGGLSALRRQFPELAIVVLTGQRDQDTCVQALDQEAQDYLVKGEVKGEGIVRSMLLAIARRARSRITQEEREALEEVAFTDPLTELLNRRGFLAELHSREVSGGTAILIDFDDFKGINSRHGHAGGDRVLSEVAERLRSLTPAGGLAARIGGDEFLLVLPECTIQEASAVAAAVRDAVGAAPVEFGEEKISVTVSLGLAWIDGKLEDIEEILERTRQPLTMSKDKGKNSFSIEGDLRPTLPQVVRFEFQPVVNLWSGEITGYEAFGRGTGKVRSPQVLFAQARLSGQETELDLICLRSACDQAIERCLSGVLFLNILPATLLECAGQVLNVLARLPLSTQVCLEIKYTSEGVSPSELAQALVPIREAGISIGFDDIGSNQRPLEHLFALRPDVVKVPLNEESRAAGFGMDSIILQSLADLGQAMGFEIIGKRVESRADVDVALSLGIQRVQGRWLDEAGDPFMVPSTDGLNPVQGGTPSGAPGTVSVTGEIIPNLPQPRSGSAPLAERTV